MLPAAVRPTRVHTAALALLLLAALPAAGAITQAQTPVADMLEHPAGCPYVTLRIAPPLGEDFGLGGGPVDAVPRGHPFALDDCTSGIRPGARMTSPAGCTFNFVFRDAANNRYIGTAAHCVSGVGQRVSAQGVGSFGAVAFRRFQGTVDFALVRVDADKVGLVNPTMCSWGGPVGADPGAGTLPRDGILEYGWGFFTESGPETRTRAHVERSNTGQQVGWYGVGSGGDSGAPVLTHGGHAAGIHTFGVDNLGPGWGFTGEGGPAFGNLLAAARTAIPSLELVAGDPTDVENALRGATYS